MKLCLSALFLCLLAVPAFAANNPTFDLLNKANVKTGTATFTLDTNKGVLKTQTTIHYLVDGSGGARTLEIRIGADGLFASGVLTNGLDRSIIYYTPAKTHDSMEVRNALTFSSRTLQIKIPEFLVAFPDDPSVWESLVRVTAAHPHTDGIYYLFVPATAPKINDRFEPFHLSDPSAGKGLLDGKEIAIQHYVLSFHAGAAHIYLDADGHVMQAESPFSGKQVRRNFELEQ